MCMPRASDYPLVAMTGFLVGPKSLLLLLTPLCVHNNIHQTQIISSSSSHNTMSSVANAKNVFEANAPASPTKRNFKVPSKAEIAETIFSGGVVEGRPNRIRGFSLLVKGSDDKNDLVTISDPSEELKPDETRRRSSFVLTDDQVQTIMDVLHKVQEGGEDDNVVETVEIELREETKDVSGLRPTRMRGMSLTRKRSSLLSREDVQVLIEKDDEEEKAGVKDEEEVGQTPRLSLGGMSIDEGRTALMEYILDRDLDVEEKVGKLVVTNIEIKDIISFFESRRDDNTDVVKHASRSK